ncbi:hypothetical protein N0V84_002100 [Fusarium piperis]|uniref:small monomeric GTPase n=1 Tax=Fusarium piperis TaxID=1435070 RepID=A0A9W8WJR3_9HYPO|nr:hypothetical protein N0V84_002100 [Fusarium piperis]
MAMVMDLFNAPVKTAIEREANKRGELTFARLQLDDLADDERVLAALSSAAVYSIPPSQASGETGSTANLTQLYSESCKRHAGDPCDLISHAKSRPETGVYYSLAGHMLVIASTVKLHILLFGMGEGGIQLAKRRLERNFGMLTNIYTYWPIINTCFSRLEAFHNACLSSKDGSFRLDRWMLQFILEFSKPVDEKDMSARDPERDLWLLDQLGRCQTLQVYLVGTPRAGLRMLLYRICTQEYCVDLPYDPTGDESGRKMVMVEQGPVIVNYDLIRSDSTCDSTFVQRLAAHSDAFICVYSVADRSSFDYVQALCRDIQVPPPPEGPVMFVAATKTDLPDWEVSLDEGRELSSSIEAELLVTSAKTGVGCGNEDVAVLVDRIYLDKARAEEERSERAANQAGDEMARSATEKSKVSLVVSRVVGRLKRLRNKQHLKPQDSTSRAAAPTTSSRSIHKTQC